MREPKARLCRTTRAHEPTPAPHDDARASPRPSPCQPLVSCRRGSRDAAPLDRGMRPREEAGAVAASYFDVDGTLIRTNLVHPTLWYLMHQRTPMRSLQKLARAAWKTPQMIWAEIQDRRMFNEILFSSYEGISKDRLMILADD